MMPYYDSRDAGGYKYGNSLYWGDPFYRLFSGNDSRFAGAGSSDDAMPLYDRSRSIGIYNRLEAYYEPRIADFLYLKVGLVAHFLESGYAGFHQHLPNRLLSYCYFLHRYYRNRSSTRMLWQKCSRQ